MRKSNPARASGQRAANLRWPMPEVTTHDYMLAWVSLAHAGTFLTTDLSNHLQKETGVSLAEQDLLSQLAKAGGDIKMVELAHYLYFSKAGVTGTDGPPARPQVMIQPAAIAQPTPAGSALLKIGCEDGRRTSSSPCGKGVTSG